MVERGRGTIVNNASISGYAWFPAATTYAAAKTGVVAFSESLRRELDGTGVNVLHLVTPGVDTDMLDATREVYGRHMDADSWGDTSPEEWAAKVVRAVERGDHVLGPGAGWRSRSSPRAAPPRCSTPSRAACSPRPAVGRLREQRLNVADAALGEPALAPREVELEQPDEATVGAEPPRPPAAASQFSRQWRSVTG